MVITREALLNGVLQQMIRDSGIDVHLLSDEERAASIAQMLAAHPGGETWVFGYGSLIWNPAFHYVDTRIATLQGWHRWFCLRTELGRGTPENPGLMMGLKDGGMSTGKALRIAEDAVETELDVIWRREMVTGAYLPTWVTLDGPDGPFPAIAFVIDEAGDRYVDWPRERIVRTLATCVGPVGRGCEYLFNTVDHLEEMGIRDPDLHALADEVRAYQETMGIAPCSGSGEAAEAPEPS
jgi:cation transport protein ChaC